MVQGDLLGGDVAGCVPAAGGDIDQSRAQAAPGDDVADEAKLRALGVERADDEHDRGSLRLRRDRLAPAPGGLVETRHLGRERAGGGLDAGDRDRLRPSGGRRRVGDVDADRAAWTGRLRCGLRPGACRRHVDGGLELGVEADAEQALLQLAVRGKARGIDDAVDAAVDHDRDVARDGGGHTDVLLDHEHGHVAVLAKPYQHLLDLGDDDGRKPLGRLVHDQELRIGEQRAGDRQHLLLAAGELAAAMILALGQSRKGLVDALDRPRPAPQARGKLQMLVDAERAPQPPALRHVADAKPGYVGGRPPGDVVAADADRAAADRHQPHDRLAQRGLAHAVATDHREYAGFERQVHALQRMRMPVVDVEAADFEGGGGERRTSFMAASEVKLLHLGIGLDLLRQAFLEDAPVVHHRDALDDA